MKKGDTVIAFGKEGTIVRMSAGSLHVKVRHNNLERWYWADSLRVIQEAPVECTCNSHSCHVCRYGSNNH